MDPLLAPLDARQRAAVTSPDVPLAIIAPAGSGKTRVLTRRIAYRVREGLADARYVLALTFTRKAAGELVDRLRRLEVAPTVTAGTFHAVALAQLRRDREPPRVLDRKARLLGPIVGGRGPAAALLVNEVAGEIEWAKARMVSAGSYPVAARAAGRKLTRPAEQVAEWFARYESDKRRRGLVDFDDVLMRTADAVMHDDAFAASQRFRFRHFFVDEFQDASPLQVRLLRAWLGEGRDLTVVGDPAQAIYGFAGADATPLTRFSSTVVLSHNYRSTPSIVAVAEAALGPAHRREAPVAVRPDGPAPTVVAYDDDLLEASVVADRCRRAFASGVPWHDMAVLFRTNAQSSNFEAAFHRRGIPFRLGEGQRFAARPAVRMLLDRLREAERDAPGRRFADLLADLATDDEDSDDVRTHRDALVEMGRTFVDAEQGLGGVAAFVSWLDASTRAEANGGDVVDLLTFHRAKGLEWPLVFVTGLERGLVPISWASTPAALDEERRLLHVACSRAEDELHCSWARARTVGARRSSREPSPWLADLEAAAARGMRTPRALSERVDDMRGALSAATPPAPRARRELR